MPPKTPLSSLKYFLLRQRVPADSISFKNLNGELKGLIIYALGYIVLGYGIGLLILNYPLPLMGAGDFIQDFWYAIVFKFVFLLLVPNYLFFFKWGYSWSDLNLGFRPKLSNWIWGTVFVLVGFFMNTRHLARIESQIPLFEDSFLRLLIGIILPLLIAGLPEELFFRGYLQTRLEKKWNRLLAILVTSLLFTAWHLPSRYLLAHGVEGEAGDFLGILAGTGAPVFLVSLFFGFHWSRYRNIVLLILVHWAIDTLPFLSSFFQVEF
ncbi:CPBP family intramembrane metalloprotease [Algoriphagus lacus]|uniref:CPBP family intramembrane metalloprotease n=1 Tax=Algoriphagus lacus TaxID=2056311 RepID=A0A418PQH9_9BACT|nr:type II CAAX endopeptidase family protein [Algoriphagus lacus]RIW14550.1 CPBP family intramembrane metalloprotease [Algoriphagus lacus]